MLLSPSLCSPLLSSNLAPRMKHKKDRWLIDGFTVCRSMKGTRMKSIWERDLFLNDVSGRDARHATQRHTSAFQPTQRHTSAFHPLKSTHLSRLDPRLTHASSFQKILEGTRAPGPFSCEPAWLPACSCKAPPAWRKDGFIRYSLPRWTVLSHTHLARTCPSQSLQPCLGGFRNNNSHVPIWYNIYQLHHC